MKKHVKKSLVSLILGATVSCVIGAFAAMSSFSVKADAPVYGTLEGFTINVEASVRSEDPNGIRFTTVLSGETKEAIADLGLSNVSYGTLLLPADLLGTEELTHSTAKVVDNKTKNWQDDTQTKYTSVLVGKDNGDGTFDNLSETYYNRPLAARSYVKGTKNGQTVIYYSENTAVRSIGYVAYMAKLGGQTTNLINDIVGKTNVELVFNSTQISANQSTDVGSTVIENTLPQSTTEAVSITVGGIPLPAKFLEENNITISYTSNSDAISVNGQTLTAEKVGSAEITASVSFTLNGKEVNETVTKEISTDTYNGKSEYKILISEDAAKAELNSATSYLPAQSSEAYNAYANAYEKTAAYKLQSVLAEATGIELPIVTAKEDGVNYISVGHTSLVPAGFTNGLKATDAKVQAINGNVILCGGGQEGTLYGVQSWLSDLVGYEYYMENSYVVNDKVEIVALTEAKTYTRSIAYNVTQSSMLDRQGALDEYGMRSYTESIIPLGTTDAEDESGYFYKGITHNSVLVLSQGAAVNGSDSTSNTTTRYNKNSGSQYYKWYATDSDKSYNSASDRNKPYSTVKYKLINHPYDGTKQIKAELCYTAHGDTTARNAMIEATASAMYAKMQKFPEYDRIGFSQMDHRIWCECEACTAKGKSDALLEFLLDVAANLETKLANAGDARASTFNICTLFYHATNQAPTNVDKTKLQNYMKHMEIWFAETSTDLIDAIELTEAEKNTISSKNSGNNVNSAIFANFKGWANVCQTYGADMFWWHYYANTTSQFIPLNTIDAMRRNYATASNYGIDYMFNQMMEFQTNWSSLKYYLMSKLTANATPDDDTWNAWIENYFVGSYGKGAEGMKAYYKAWCDLTNRDDVKNEFRRDSTYNPLSGDGAVMSVDARKWTSIFTESELKSWISKIDTAIEALDVSDPNYETYYRNIMLEKLVPMYLLMWMYDDYTPTLTSPTNWLGKPESYDSVGDREWFTINPNEVGTFSSTTYVGKYGAEFLTWVKNWNITYDGENDTRVLKPFLQAIEGKGNAAFTSTVVSDRIVAEAGQNVTLYSAALTAGSYEVSGTLTSAKSATVSTDGQVTIAAGSFAVGEVYNVTFTNTTTKNSVTFANIMLATKSLAGNADAVEGKDGYYVVDKTYYIEEGTTSTWLTHKLFTKGAYTVTIDGNSTKGTVFYTGQLNVTLGNLLNGEQRNVIVVDDNNNTYVFNVVCAKYIRTAEELLALGVGGKEGNGLIQNSGVSGNDVTGVYVLVNDIDCAGVFFAAGYSYQQSFFKGTFDGNGYTLSNVTVGSGGIFGGMNGATIKNLIVRDVVYNDNDGNRDGFWGNYTALFAHYADKVTFKNITVFVSKTHSRNTWEFLEGLLVASTQKNGVAYENITINAHGLAVETALGSNIEDTTVYNNVVINAASYKAIGYTESEFPTDPETGKALTDRQNTAALLAAWPKGVLFNITSNSFAITNTETTVSAGSTLTITTDKAYSYTYALKEAVDGISVSATGVVTVDGSVKVGQTFTVVVTEAKGWYEEITLTVIKQVETFSTVYDVEAGVDKTIKLPAVVEGYVLSVKLGDFVVFDRAEGIGSINGNVVTPDSMPVRREDLGKGKAYEIETSTAIYKGSVNVYTQIINTKEELNNFETVAADNSVKAGYVIEEQKYAYLSGYFILGNDIAYNDVWYPALSYAGNNNPAGLKKGTIYNLCNQTNDNVKNWVTQYGEDKVIQMNGWTNTNKGGFQATLDGDGYTIEGFQTAGKYNGLSALGGDYAVIKNIAFTGVKVGADASLLFGFNNSTIENVYIEVLELQSGNSAESTELIGHAGNAAAALKNIVVDATNCDISSNTKAYFISLSRSDADGVYVIGGGLSLAETTTDGKIPAAFWEKATNDQAAKFDSVFELLGDATHGAIVNGFDTSFWTIDEEGGYVLPTKIYLKRVAEELDESFTIERLSGAGSFVLPNQIEGNITKVIIGTTIFEQDSIDGLTVSFTENDFVAQDTLGRDLQVQVFTDVRNYVGTANVYTMIINNVAELESWMEMAANNAVQAGICLEAQKGYVYSGYFVLGADIEYNKTWKPYKEYGDIWALYGNNPAIKDAEGNLVEGAINEDWGTGNKAGFKGVFDGDGHYISGVSISGKYNAFIVTGGGGTMRNIAFTNAKIGSQASLLINRGPCNFENVYVQVASIENGTAYTYETQVITRDGADKGNRSVLVDMSKANLNGAQYMYVTTLQGKAANGVYVIGAEEITTFAKNSFETESAAAIFTHYNGNAGNVSDYDIAGSFATTAALLADGTHGANVRGWDTSFWTIDTVNNIVCPTSLYEAILAESLLVELDSVIDIEQVQGSFVLPNQIEGNITKVIVGSTIFGAESINGLVVSLGENDFTKMEDLGKNVPITVETDSKKYVGYVNVYTMIIDDKAELNSWQSVAADNSVKAGIVIEAQKKAVLSGYFILGDNIDYNDTWTPILDYSHIWHTLDKGGSVGSTVKDDPNAIFEDWGNGDKAGFKGVFDGNGYYIDGMATSGEYSGFVVTLGGGTIKDVAFTNASIGQSAGFVTDRGPGKIENVYVEVVSIASGASAGSYTTVISMYNNPGKELSNIVVDMSKANLTGLKYAMVSTLVRDPAYGVYVIGANELTQAKQDFSEDASAVVFLHYNPNSQSADYDIAGSFATTAELMADETRGAYVKAHFSASFWTVTADNVKPNCLVGNYDATNRVTVDLGYAVSNATVTQAAETTVDITEIAGLLNGKTATVKLNGSAIYEGVISGDSLTLSSSLFTVGGDNALIFEYEGGKIYLPIYVNDVIELNQANAGTPDNLKNILISKLDGHFVLTSDLDMGGKYLKSIDTFSGILDGNGYGIINTYISMSGDTTGENPNTDYYSPQFINLNLGTIKNIYFEIKDFSWVNTSANPPTDAWHGNGKQGIISRNEGRIQNVYANITLQHSALSKADRGLLTKENAGVIQNVVVDVRALDGVTLYEDTIAAITYYQNGTVENAYVVTNNVPGLISSHANPNPCFEVETIYELPLATIQGWSDFWSNMEILNGEVFFNGTGFYGSELFVPYYSATKTAVSEYTGDATAMGFAADDTVYEVVSTDSWSNRINVGNSTYADYLVFDFARTDNTKNFTVWLTRNHTIVGGESYVITPSGSWAKNESKTDRSFHVVDQNGNHVTSTMELNTKYTLYVHLGGEVDIDGIMFGTGANFYIANVRYASGPATLLTHNNSKKMELYMGNAKDIGFNDGDIVYQMVTNDLVAGSLWWQTGTETINGQTVDCSPNSQRQSQSTKPYIPTDTSKPVVKVDFALSKAITSGDVFYIWGTSSNGVEFGNVSVNTYSESKTGNGFRAAILDKNGSYVSSLQANTAYTLVMYMPDATMFNIGNIAAEGMTTYFLASSVENLEESVLDLGSTKIAPQYEGDVTKLGFAEGTTVYQSVQDTRSNMWGAGTTANLSMAEQALYLTKAVDEDYVSVQFSLSRKMTGTYAFFVWWYNEAGANQGGGGYMRTNGQADGCPDGMNVVAIDLATGEAATSFEVGKAYELRWYGEGATKFQLACCEQNGEAITVYFANPTSGNDA